MNRLLNSIGNVPITTSIIESFYPELKSADIRQVKDDVLPFVRNQKELDIWSNDYFVQLADIVRME